MDSVTRAFYLEHPKLYNCFLTFKFPAVHDVRMHNCLQAPANSGCMGAGRLTQFIHLTSMTSTYDTKLIMATGCSRRLFVLVDLSGTLHIGNSATEGAVEALKRLRSFPGVRLKFVTNTTKESCRYLQERLAVAGFQIEQRDIFSSLTAARRLVESRSLCPLLLLEDVALEDFQGIPYVLPGATGTASIVSPNAVVIGLAPSRFTYESVNEAFQLVLNNNAELIAIHKGRYYKSDDGKLSLGPGPFVEAIEYATERKATVVGKPERQFFLDAIKSLASETREDIDLNDCVMIGDDAIDDVGGAQAAGIKGILVKTGKYRPGDENKINPAPFALVDNFAEAVHKIEHEWFHK